MYSVTSKTLNLILLTSLAFIGQLTAQSQTQGSYDKLSYYYYNKCFNETGSRDVFQKLYSDTIELQTFLNYTFYFIPKEKNLFCNEHRKAIEVRLTEINNDLKACLPRKEKFLGDFLETSFKEFLHFLCHHDGANINRIFREEIQAKNCRESLQAGASKELSQCFSRIFKPSGTYIQKKEVCDDMTTAQKCFTQALESKCSHYDNYKTLNEEFFNYIKKPCSGCAMKLNILLLLICLIITYSKVF